MTKKGLEKEKYKKRQLSTKASKIKKGVREREREDAILEGKISVNFKLA